jgi:hypothetical protein
VTALPDHLEPVPAPAPSVTFEHQHLPRGGGAIDRIERVEQRRPGEQRSLARGARWRQARLGAAREGLLGDHK